MRRDNENPSTDSLNYSYQVFLINSSELIQFWSCFFMKNGQWVHWWWHLDVEMWGRLCRFFVAVKRFHLASLVCVLCLRKTAENLPMTAALVWNELRYELLGPSLFGLVTFVSVAVKGGAIPRCCRANYFAEAGHLMLCLVSLPR